MKECCWERAKDYSVVLGGMRWPDLVVSSVVSFIIHRLEIGTALYAKDFAGKWYAAVVVDSDLSHNRIMVHFIGWDTKWNEWYDIESPQISYDPPKKLNLHRFPAFSLSAEDQAAEHLQGRLQDKSISQVEYKRVLRNHSYCFAHARDHFLRLLQ